MPTLPAPSQRSERGGCWETAQALLRWCLTRTTQGPAPLSQGRLGPGEEATCRPKPWHRSLDPEQRGDLTVVRLLRVGPRGRGQPPLGLRPTAATLFTRRTRAAWGLASLTTCLRPGWSCRWGPRRVRSAARPSSHHCRVPGGGQQPILTQQAPGASTPTPCPKGSAVHLAAGAQGRWTRPTA